MPTLTKPKRPIDPKITPVKIPLKHRRNIADTAALDHTSRAGKAFLRDIEKAITWHATMIARLSQRSLPAHTIASLRPIAKRAFELAFALHRERLPIEVSSALGDEVSTGAAHAYLAEIAATAQRAMSELESQSGQGVLDRRRKEAREQALADLDSLYQDFASGDCDADDRAEFLATCGNLLEPRKRATSG